MKKHQLLWVVLAVILSATACTSFDASDGPRIDVSCATSRELVQLTRRGYFLGRSPDISVIPREPNFVGAPTNPPHTGPWPFLVDVPLVLHGPGFVQETSEIDRRAGMADLAPTAAHLVGFEGWRARSGRLLSEALIDTEATPRLVVTIVWDGAGWNALHEHPQQWPFLRSLMRRGTSYTNFTVGSNPSVTPPVHASLGTGTYPDDHGITGVSQRTTRNQLVDPWAHFDSKLLRVPTLADLYDRALSNQPLTGMVARVNWHLGMIGHGASFPGGDRDEVLMLDHSGEPRGNENDYLSPGITEPALLDRFARDLDAEDGAIDDKWLGNPLNDPGTLGKSPAFTRYAGVMLRRMIDQVGFGMDETPDLLYVNMKETDLSYHAWGMDSPEVGAALKAQDESLRLFLDHLDEHVATGNWVVMITADHGLMPDPEESGAYPINGQGVLDDVNARFDANDNDADLAYHMTAYGIYVEESQLAANDVSLEEIGRWLADYRLGENLVEDTVPDRFEDQRDERLFSAITVGTRRVDPCRKES